jgi:C-terminal processing protease CtpA/Prc
MPGGPAELSGKLNPGDRIVSVAQGEAEPTDVVDMKLSRS